MAHDTQALLARAVQQVQGVRDDVAAAVVPAGAGHQVECVARLKAAQQRIDELSRLAGRITAAAAEAAAQQGAAANAEQQGSQQQQHWHATQQQARAAQQSLHAAVLSALAQPQPQLTLGPAADACGVAAPGPDGEPAWLLLLQRVQAAAPHVQLHVLCDGSQYLCSSVGASPVRHLHNCKHADEVRLVCPGVFVASVALLSRGQLQPVRVLVDSVDKASSIDPWGTARHQVFRRINLLAVTALSHFQRLQAVHAALQAAPPGAAAPNGSAAGGAGGAPGHRRSSVAGDVPAPAAAAASAAPAAASAAAAAAGRAGERPAAGLALECLLLWLSCYSDLFSRPCDVSGKVVAWAPASNLPLPPLVRPYWLTLEQLTAAAANTPGSRRAYHAHLAPWPHTASARDLEPAAEGGFGQPANTRSAADALHAGECGDDELRAQLRQIVGDVW